MEGNVETARKMARPGGRADIEDELVGAAMQISELRQENKKLKRTVASSYDEITRLKEALKDQANMLQDQAAKHASSATELESRFETEKDTAARFEAEREDMKKNEEDAVDTARKAFAEIEKRNEEIKKLKLAIGEGAKGQGRGQVQAAAALVETLQTSPLPRPSSSSPAEGGGAGAGTEAPGKGKGSSRYCMADDKEDEKKGGKDGSTINRDDSERESDGDGNGDSGSDGNAGSGQESAGGFFSWLTGSAKKRRRVE